MTDTNTPQPVTPFAVGQRVRVTPEYAAWYRRLYGEPAITPELKLVVVRVTRSGAIVEANPVWLYIPRKYLVSAEENETS